MITTLQHLNSVLRAILNVNRTITLEKDKKKLIQNVCDQLTETRGYHSAWIALFNGEGRYDIVAQAGIGTEFDRLKAHLAAAPSLVCAQHAHTSNALFVSKDPERDCPSCLLADQYIDKAGMAIRLSHKNQYYGLICVSIPEKFAQLKAEADLFCRMSQDISYALYNIDLEEAQTIIKRERQEISTIYNILSEYMNDGVVLIQDKKRIYANDSFFKITGLKHTVNREDAESLFGPHLKNRSTLNTHIDKLIEGNESKASFEIELIPDNPPTIWVSVTLTCIQWKGNPAVLGTLKDISDLKQKEKSIREEAAHLRRENLLLKTSFKDRFRFGNIIGKSIAMQNVYDLIVKAADTDANIVINGESGTGKELVAEAIHNLSERNTKKFITVNCGAIPETLLESEFFGYQRGAFTGASSNKYGYLKMAEGGTLFLDEIAELTLNMQVKLLRAIDGGGYIPIGSTKKTMSACRIIAATHKNLKNQVTQGLLRDDFYYRINVITITLPPLRERKEDIPLLTDHFLKLSPPSGATSKIPAGILDTFYNYDWPGNVRELQNVIHRYLAVGHIDLCAYAADQIITQDGPITPLYAENTIHLKKAIADFEKKYLAKALEENKWHREKTARSLGLSHATFFRKLKRQ